MCKNAPWWFSVDPIQPQSQAESTETFLLASAVETLAADDNCSRSKKMRPGSSWSLCGAAAHFRPGPLGGRGHSPSRPENHRTPTPSLRLFQNVCKPAEEAQRPPTLQEIKQKIASYNSREKNCLGMKLVSGPAHPRPPRAFRSPRPIPLAPCPLLVRSSAVPLHCGAAPIEVLSVGL